MVEFGKGSVTVHADEAKGKYRLEIRVRYEPALVIVLSPSQFEALSDEIRSSLQVERMISRQLDGLEDIGANDG